MSRNSNRFAPSAVPVLTALVMVAEQLDEMFETTEAGDPEESTGVLSVNDVRDGLVYEVEVWECSCEPTYGRKMFGDKEAAVVYFNEVFESGWTSDRVRLRVLRAGVELLCEQFIEKEVSGVRRYRRMPQVA